jgi:DNA-binding protein HU-beta
MNTTELVNYVSEQADLTKAKSTEVVNLILVKIIAEVESGEQVKLSGFGSFYSAGRKARRGRNPQNGDPVDIPAVTIPRFKPGKCFKDVVKEAFPSEND